MTFEARILGPVEASMDGRPVALGSPKQRAVFALLVLHGGRVVSTDRLVAELWGEDPPRSPVSTLQVYISRLRRSMGGREESEADGAPDAVRLVRRSPGYQLTLPTGSVDADRFAALVAAARTRLAENPVQARQMLDDALRLQRGAPLADVVELLGPNASAEAQRLDDLRLTALQLRLQAMLAQGEAGAAAAEAAGLVREHPLQEELHAALMLALYRSGRQAEALQAFELVRGLLADQLGVDPGAGLRELQRRILQQDPSLDGGLPVALPAVADPAVPAPEPALDRHQSLPSRTPGPATGWVPDPLTSLVGRDHELGAAVAALERARLMSLTGTGGSGKTRLAIAVLARVRSGYPAGVWWVDLSTVTEPASVARLVAAAIGGHELVERPPLESAAAEVGSGTGLLVLDSCEHLAAAAAEAAHRLLTRCPALRVLTTTREPLGVPGELVWPVPPLALPSDARPSRAEVAASAAGSLWCERAGSALPGFELTEDNAALVARICRRLDGLPLAIELAAARLRVLSLEEIADALDSHLEVLRGQDRTAPGRHQTLRATLDWSFRLLSAEEQVLLAELSVFQGGFTLSAVTAVREPTPGAASTLDLVSRLIDRSLLTVVDRGRPTRYRLLETVRLYAAEALEEAGRTAGVADRHLQHFLALAELAEPRLTGSAQQEWLGLLDAEVGNLVGALGWAVSAGRSPEAGLRLVTALWRFWYLRGHYSAGREWFRAALAAAAAAPAASRAQALAAAGQLAYLQCDYPRSAELLGEAQQIFEALRDPLGVATVLQLLGCVAREQGDYARSRRLHQDSEQRWRAAGNEDAVARSANYLGFVAWLEGDEVTARQQSERALGFYRTSGDSEGLTWSLLILGATACYAGDLERAHVLLSESRQRAEESGYREGLAWSLNQLGVLAARRGDPVTGAMLQRNSLREHWQLGDLWRTASVLEALALSDAGAERHRPALRLLAAAASLRSRLQAPLPPVERAEVVTCLQRLRSAVPADVFAAAWADGEATALDQTVRRAGEEPRTMTPGTPNDDETAVPRC
ncbi:MAG: AfsR/SARP family transcriptional regulator [Friedmanniella sp.]